MTDCLAVQQAIERSRRMHREADAKGIWFDHAAADRIVHFCEYYCRHWKGRMAGKLFKLASFQKFILREIYGWKRRSDKTRLFRQAFILLPRKNSKTFLVAIMALYALVGDGEAGGEVYAAATKREQAKRVFDDVTNVIRMSHPDLKAQLEVGKHRIIHPKTGSFMAYLSSDSKTLDGLNTSFASIDEIQEHPSREVYDKICTSVIQRAQPLVATIGTAGEDDLSIAGELYDYSKAILDPGNAVEDDTWFAYITEADEGDDWEQEETWIKANPLLGTAMSMEDFRNFHNKASNIATEKNAFRRLHLNTWVQSSETVWLDPDAWDACQAPYDLDALKGRDWVAGLDLSSSIDLTCLSLLSIPKEKGEPIVVHPMFFLPEENVHKKVMQDKVPYDVWQAKGYITLTQGNVVDYRAILRYLLDLREAGFSIKEIHYDDWNATSIINMLMENGFDCIKFIQGLRSYHPVCQLFEEKVIGREIQHDNPILTWNARNVRVRTDDKGKRQPTKKNVSSILRIDGIVASLMGMDYFVRNLTEPAEEEWSFFAVPANVRASMGIG